MNIILVEVSHWHFPLYVEALLASGARVTGLSERDSGIRSRYAALFDCPGYADWRELVAASGRRGRTDAAFAFGRHVEMPNIGLALVGQGIPFAIEKPAGLSAGDVASLRSAATAAGIPVAVPLVQRIGPLAALLDRLAASEAAAFATQSWRFNAGPPERYTEAGCGWMLDPAASGGGCLINLAVHFVDLALRLMPSPPNRISAHVGSAVHAAAVEDSAVLTLTAPDGGRATIEAGYNFPDCPEKRDFGFALARRGLYVASEAGGVGIHRPGAAVEHVGMTLDSDPLYGLFAARFLADIAAGRKPGPGLDALEAAVRVVDAGYAAARAGQPVCLRRADG